MVPLFVAFVTDILVCIFWGMGVISLYGYVWWQGSNPWAYRKVLFWGFKSPDFFYEKYILMLYILWKGFLDLWSGQNPGWNLYLTSVENFGEVRRAQLAKSTLLTSTLVPVGFFTSFKVCSDAEESGVWKATGSYSTYLSLAKLQPGSWIFDGRPVFGRTAALVPALAVKDLRLGRIFWWYFVKI